MKTDSKYFILSELELTRYDTADLTLKISDRKYEIGSSYVARWPITVKWSTYKDRDGAWQPFYFDHLSINLHGLWDFDESVSVARTIRDIFRDKGSNPQVVMDNLRSKLRFAEVINDPRLHQFLLPRDIAPISWTRYVARAINDSNPGAERIYDLAECIAEDERSARNLFSETIMGTEGDVERSLKEWASNNFEIVAADHQKREYWPEYWNLTFNQKYEVIFPPKPVEPEQPQPVHVEPEQENENA